MDEILKAVINFLLQYANPVVGIIATFSFEWLKRNVIEKFLKLSDQLKKWFYWVSVIFYTVGVAELVSLGRNLLVKFAPGLLLNPDVSYWFPTITNIWIVGLATGVLIDLGYAYQTKKNAVPN